MAPRLVELYSVIKEIDITSGFDIRPEIRGHYCVQHVKLPRPTDFGGIITTGLLFSYHDVDHHRIQEVKLPPSRNFGGVISKTVDF